MSGLHHENRSTEFTDSQWPNSYVRVGYLPINPDDCSYVWHIPAQDRCEWVRTTEDCASVALFQYAQILFCFFHTENMFLFCLGLSFLIVWLLYMFLILGTTADNFCFHRMAMSRAFLKFVAMILLYHMEAVVMTNSAAYDIDTSEMKDCITSLYNNCTGDIDFCPSLAVIASVLRMSESIAGVTILAFGNGAPDIFTSIVLGMDEGIIMFTELLGAGIFVTAIIAGSVAIVNPFRVRLGPFMRDSCFYIFVVCWISYVVRDETIYFWEAISFVLCYVLFITTVIVTQIYENREEKLKTRIPTASDPDVLRTYLANKDTATIPKLPMRTRATGLRAKLDLAIATEIERTRLRHRTPLPIPEMEEEEEIYEERPKGLFNEFLFDINPIGKGDWVNASRITKFILIIRAPAMFLLLLFVPLVNPTSAKRGWSKLLNCFQLCVTPTVALFLLNVWTVHIGPVSIVPIFLLLGAVVAVIVFLITQEDQEPRFHNAFSFVGFFTAMLAVYLVAGEVMAVLRLVGHVSSISDAMLGITFLAWGNSIGDLISNVAIARQGFPQMGYAACFGGPMFNTLLGLGLTYGTASSKQPHKCITMRMSDMAPGCIAFLLCSLLTSIIYLNFTGSIARKSYGYLLCSLYFAFLLMQFLSEFQVMHPLGTDHRPEGDLC